MAEIEVGQAHLVHPVAVSGALNNLGPVIILELRHICSLSHPETWRLMLDLKGWEALQRLVSGVLFSAVKESYGKLTPEEEALLEAWRGAK